VQEIFNGRQGPVSVSCHRRCHTCDGFFGEDFYRRRLSSTGSQLEQTRRVVNADGLKAGTDVFIGRGSLPELEGRDCGELPRRSQTSFLERQRLASVGGIPCSAG